MEKNKKMNTKKKSLIPVLAVVAAVAICALCAVGILLSKQNTGKDGSKNTIQLERNEAGEMLAKDEASLRQLLKEDATYTILVSEDITVSEPLEVNGTKTLVGDKSIIMDLNTEAKERVLSVSANAHLVLDGVTIDGNGVSSGIAVKADGKLECLSGNIVYPMPYGIVTEGKVTIEDITIDRSMHTGIYVESGGELDMSGGRITNCIQTGIATSKNAYAKVSKDCVVTQSAGSLFYNYGTLDITGGTYSESYSNCIYNKGELNIISESDDKLVEFFNSGRSIISSVAGTTVTIDGLYAHDMAAHVMNLEKDSIADVKNVLVENSGKSCFYTNGSTLTMEAVELKNIKSVGINITNKSTAQLTDITITNGGHRGIINDSSNVTMKNIAVDNLVGAGVITIGENSNTTIEAVKISKVGKSGIGITGGTVTAKDIEITDAAGTAIYTTTAQSKTTIDGAKLVNSGKSAIGVSVGNLTATNVEISGTKNTGVYIQEGAKLTLTNATVRGVNKHGIANYFGTAALRNVRVEAPTNAGILNQGTLTGENVTINNSGSRALSLTDASNTNINGLVINKSKNQSVYIDNVTRAHISNFTINKSGQSAFRITKSTDVLLKSGEITDANGDGIWVSEGAKIKVQDTVIKAPTKYGVEVYAAEKMSAEVTAVNVTVNNARAGFVNNGGTLNGNTLTVNNSISRSLNLVNSGTTSITGLNVKNAGDQGVYIEGTEKVVLKEINIDTTKGAAIRASKATNVSIKTGTIKNAGSDGVYVGEGAAIKVEAVDISDAAGYGLMVASGELTAIDIGVTNVKAGLVNNGGTVNASTVSIDKTTSRALSLVGGSTTKITGLTVKNAGNQGVYAENSTVKISTFTVDTTQSAAFCLGKTEEIDEAAVENVTLTDGWVKNSGSTGIYVGKTAVANVTGVTIENSKQHGIQNAGGKLTGGALTINQSANRAVTMAADSETTINGLNITGTGDQAVYVDGAKESKTEIKGFNISGSGSAAVRVMNTTGVKLTDGTINATTYGIAISGNASAIAEDVRIIRQENNPNYLVWIMANSSLTMQNGEETVEDKQSLVDGQEAPGIGVWIDKGGSFNLKGGTIANSKGNTSEGAGVYVCEGASFVMDGGVIKNNETTNTSGGVAARGAFTLNGGKIQENKASKGAGVMVRSTGTFTMTGGEISGNIASADGGGIFIQTSTADVNITGGTIQGNKANAGGGIYMSCSKTVNMNNATVQKNEAATNGGGVYVNQGVFTMKGGKIQENTAKKFGAGVFAYGTFNMEAGEISNHGSEKEPLAVEGAGVCIDGASAVFTMNGGEIKNNYASKAGAGVSVRNGNAAYPKFTMNGGAITANHTTGSAAGIVVRTGVFTMNEGSTISNNTAGNLGGGLYLAGGTTFNLNGGTFADNSAGARGKDMYLEGKITLQKALADEISISPSKYTESRVVALKGELTDVEFQDAVKKLSVEDDNGVSWYVDGDGKLQKGQPDSGEPDGGEPDGGEPDGGETTASVKVDGVGYASLSEALAAVGAESTIEILQDQVISAPAEVTGKLTLTCAENVTITASDSLDGNMFNVANGGTLVINGAAADKKITLAGGSATDYVINNNGTALLSNVNITGGVRGIHHGSGTLGTAETPLVNVTVSNASEYGVYVYTGNVNIGSITVNNAGHSAIYIQKEGATVSIHKAELYNSGSYGLVVKKGTVTVKNTVIDNSGITDTSKNRIGIAAHGGILNLDNVAIKNFVGSSSKNNNHGIELAGSVLTVTANETVDGGNKGLYVYNVKGHGLYATKGSMNIAKISIEGNGQIRAGIRIYASETMTNVITSASVTGCAADVQIKNTTLTIHDVVLTAGSSQVQKTIDEINAMK